LLKNIDPLLSPELLKLLAEMGHEDAVVLADANFTAMRYRASTTSQTIVRMPGVGLARATSAVLSVLPLGTAAEQPVRYMQVEGLAQGAHSPLQREVLALVEAAEPMHAPEHAVALDRFDFYLPASLAYVIVQTGELQPYGNFLFKKGVITALT
jgi:L-fucose mutarotase